MSETGPTETIITFDLHGTTYEIDHLGIGWPSQWGEFAVYRDGRHVAEFAIEEAGLRPEFRPDALPPDDELIRLARQAIATEEAADMLGEG